MALKLHALALATIATMIIIMMGAATASGPSDQTACQNLNINIAGNGQSYNTSCYWAGGNATIRAGTGLSGWMGYKITGSNGVVYVKSSATSWCLSNVTTLYLPAQEYYISVDTGKGGGSCSYANGDAVLLLVPAAHVLISPSTPQSTTSVQSATTVPSNTSVPITTSVPANTSIYINSGSLPASTSKGAGGYAIPFAILLILVYVASFVLRIRRARRRRTSLTRNRTVFGTGASGGAATQAMQNPQMQYLASSNPELTKLISKYLQRRRLQGGSIYGHGRGRVITYCDTAPDTFDGM